MPQNKRIEDLIKKEEERQDSYINLIPSENITSKEVRKAVGSVLMHKYSEGNIGKRYYQGNDVIDEIEQLTIDRAKRLFKLPKDWDVNVQAVSGSNANLAVYLALLEPGDTILSMYLPDGGHLSHGWSLTPGEKQDSDDPIFLGGEKKVTLVSKLFNIVQYKLNPETHLLDYNSLRKIALKHKPKLIITGGTAYPRDINYKRVKEIAEEVGAKYLADIAHEAGLIAAGVLPSPVGIADVVTMTTHKTLRAARGALILSDRESIQKVNKAILPGLQGGPMNHNIAGICVGLGEALKPDFKDYAEQVLKNAKTLETELKKHGFKLISGGTDKHLLLIDLTDKGISGKQAATSLEKAGIVVNMNAIPGEQKSPIDPSGIRIGTPFVTSQGMKEEEMKKIAEWIREVIDATKVNDKETIQKTNEGVENFMENFRFPF